MEYTECNAHKDGNLPYRAITLRLLGSSMIDHPRREHNCKCGEPVRAGTQYIVYGVTCIYYIIESGATIITYKVAMHDLHKGH